ARNGLPPAHEQTGRPQVQTQSRKSGRTEVRVESRRGETGLDRARPSVGCDDVGCRNWAASGSFLRDLPDHPTSSIERQGPRAIRLPPVTTPRMSPLTILTPSKPCLVFTDIVGIKIDVQTRYLAVSKLENVAETSAGSFTSGPGF